MRTVERLFEPAQFFELLVVCSGEDLHQRGDVAGADRRQLTKEFFDEGRIGAGDVLYNVARGLVWGGHWAVESAGTVDDETVGIPHIFIQRRILQRIVIFVETFLNLIIRKA